MLTLKLKNLVELNALQESITDRILSVIEDDDTEWEYHSVSKRGDSYCGDTEYFSTSFSKGYILLKDHSVYYGLLNKDQGTWIDLEHQSLYLGSFDIAFELYRKLDDMHYRMEILNA